MQLEWRGVKIDYEKKTYSQFSDKIKPICVDLFILSFLIITKNLCESIYFESAINHIIAEIWQKSLNHVIRIWDGHNWHCFKSK